MIELIDSIDIAATPDRIMHFAAPVERWPSYLPHYRHVRVLSGDAHDRVVRMSASRSGIPVSWVARQRIDETIPRLRFTHLRGWTRGMEVAWNFEATPDGTRVSIVHELDFRFPVAAAFLGRHVVGAFFISNIAGKTLRRIKALAESA